MKIKWIKIETDDQDFRTHSNYVAFFNDITKNLKIKTSVNFHSEIKKPISALDKKIRLTKLIHSALVEENKIIRAIPEYAIPASSWIAVRSYYLLFDLLLITKYLIECESNAFNSTHSGIQNFIKKSIQTKDFFFNIQLINNVYKIKEILNWSSPQKGSNLERITVDQGIRYLQIIKKLAKYRKDEYRRRLKIKSLRGENKNKFENLEINICEFFYLYRIKSNYRDLEFLSRDINTEEFTNFYNNYFQLTQNFYNAFIHFINHLYKIRIKETKNYKTD